jgi:hypothetical protein
MTDTIIYIVHGIGQDLNNYAYIFGCFTDELEAYKMACKKQYKYILKMCKTQPDVDVILDSETSRNRYHVIKNSQDIEEWIDYFKTKECDFKIHNMKPEDVQLLIDLEKLFNQALESNLFKDWQEFYNELRPSCLTKHTIWDKIFLHQDFNLEIEVREMILNNSDSETLCMQFWLNIR